MAEVSSGGVEAWSREQLEAELARLREAERAREEDDADEQPEPREAISWRVTRGVLELLERRVEPRVIDALLEDAGLDPVAVRRRRRWWTWEEYCAIARALEPLAESGEARAAGRAALSSPVLQFLRVGAGPFYPIELALAGMKRLAVGPGGVLFRGFEVEIRRTGTDRLEVLMTPPPGELLPPLFVETTRGFLEGAPETPDSGARRVTAEPLGRSVSFGIRYERPRLLRRLLSVVDNLTPRVAARAVSDAREELAGQNELLRRRIGELEASERARAILQAELEEQERMEAVGRFAGGVAHDFNNLLTVILGQLSLLEPQLADPSSQRDLSAIGEASERAAALCRQLLAVGRQQPMDIERVDLRALVEERRELLTSAASEPIRVRFELGETGWVRADTRSLERVLMDLVSNARAAMPDGGELVVRTGREQLDARRAKTRRVRASMHASLTLVDDGCGMTDEVRARALEPFYTTRSDAGARGLGLSSAFGIVRQLGGALWLRSAPGDGTEVHILIPNDRVPGEEAPS
ncbi:MAG: hypothetical protein SangKO_027110 [Sandaracinaceae bacterium]